MVYFTDINMNITTGNIVTTTTTADNINVSFILLPSLSKILWQQQIIDYLLFDGDKRKYELCKVKFLDYMQYQMFDVLLQ